MRLQNGADMKFWDQYHWHLNTVQLSYHIHFSFKYYLFFPIQYYIPTIISFLSAKPSLPNLHWLMLSLWRRQWKPTPVLLPGKSHGWRSLVGCKIGRATRLNNFTFTFHFHALEKEMATHSSILTWRIPGTGEPGGLPSMG